MYCSECKLRVADDSVVTCPVCQGPLQSESETGEQPESVDFVGELASVFEADQDPDIKLEDKLDAYVRDDANLDFDPEALGLKSSEEEDPEASADDIRVLADLWEKEDIGADLDGVFADAFNLEEVESESVPEEQTAMKSEKAVPETPTPSTPTASTPVMSTLESSTPAPAENPRKTGLPLFIFIVLLIAGGGGWFYMQSAGVKPEKKLIREIKSPAPVSIKSQNKPQLEPAVVSNEPVEDKVVSVVDSSVAAVVKSQPVGDKAVETSAGDKSDSLTGVETKAVASAPASLAENEAVVADSQVKTSETSGQPAVESLVTAASAPSSMVENKTLSEPESKPTAESQMSKTQLVEKVVPEPVPVKEKAVAVPEKANPAVAPAVTVTGPRYVVHIGSFRNEAGAARQLAKLQKKGFAAYKVEVDLGAKGVWQRIFVPGGVSKSAARQVQEQLTKSFPREDSLVRRIKK